MHKLAYITILIIGCLTGVQAQPMTHSGLEWPRRLNLAISTNNPANNGDWIVTWVSAQYPTTNIYPLTNVILYESPSEAVSAMVTTNTSAKGGRFELNSTADWAAIDAWNTEHGGVINYMVGSDVYLIFTNPTPNISNTLRISFTGVTLQDNPVGNRDGSIEDNCYINFGFDLNRDANEIPQTSFYTNMILDDVVYGSTASSTTNLTMTGYMRLWTWTYYGTTEVPEPVHQAKLYGTFRWDHYADEPEYATNDMVQLFSYAPLSVENLMRPGSFIGHGTWSIENYPGYDESNLAISPDAARGINSNLGLPGANTHGLLVNRWNYGSGPFGYVRYRFANPGVTNFSMGIWYRTGGDYYYTSPESAIIKIFNFDEYGNPNNGRIINVSESDKLYMYSLLSDNPNYYANIQLDYYTWYFINFTYSANGPCRLVVNNSDGSVLADYDFTDEFGYAFDAIDIGDGFNGVGAQTNCSCFDSLKFLSPARPAEIFPF